MTFGYDSVVAFSKSAAEIDDFALELLERLDVCRRGENVRFPTIPRL